MKTKKTTTVKIQTTFEFTRADVIRALNVPKGSRIYMDIPGGGDWSSQPLILGDDCDFLCVQTPETTERTEA